MLMALPAAQDPRQAPATSFSPAPLRGRAEPMQGTAAGNCLDLVSGIYLIALDEFVTGYLVLAKYPRILNLTRFCNSHLDFIRDVLCISASLGIKVF